MRDVGVALGRAKDDHVIVLTATRHAVLHDMTYLQLSFGEKRT